VTARREDGLSARVCPGVGAALAGSAARRMGPLVSGRFQTTGILSTRSARLHNGHMSASVPPSRPESQPPPPPEVTALMLSTFADLHRQEVGAKGDLHRTLPFFGTALGIVIGAVAYAAGRLPKWTDLATHRAEALFVAASLLLGLAVVKAGCVLVFISRAIARRNYQRIGPETALRTRFSELQAYYDAQGTTGEAQDAELAHDMRQTLLDSYTTVTPINRGLNQRRYKLRALASSHLVRSLVWALGATAVIFAADKLGYLPKVNL